MTDDERTDKRTVTPDQCDHEPSHAYCSRCCPCHDCYEIREADYERERQEESARQVRRSKEPAS